MFYFILIVIFLFMISSGIDSFSKGVDTISEEVNRDRNTSTDVKEETIYYTGEVKTLNINSINDVRVHQVRGKGPVVATGGSAGLDLYNNSGEEFIVESGETAVINTYTRVAIPEGYVGLVVIRSGHGFRGLNLINSVGVIDSDYRGAIKAKVMNTSKDTITIQKEERFAQMIIVPYLRANIINTEYLGDTERGENGFNSTGIN